ncbi:MAG: M28 family peptidase [Crocinitomicaceae bacterium]|nr:M28 family peptidase [Crocinitomicaceae bacterium]
MEEKLFFNNIIEKLSSESFGGRCVGSEGEKKTGALVVDFFESQGLTKIGNQFHHAFSFHNGEKEIESFGNILGFKNFKQNETVIICAHYDHLGFENLKSRSLGSKAYHPGADDNASGVAMMLQLLKWIGRIEKIEKANYNFLFLATSGHEDGLFGAQYFVENLAENFNEIKLVINLDMLGRLNPNVNTIKITRSESTSDLDNSLYSAAKNLINLRITAEQIKHSDAWPFIQQNIPAITISTGIHDDYHKISDTPEKINYDGMLLLYEFTKNLILNLNKHGLSQSDF